MSEDSKGQDRKPDEVVSLTLCVEGKTFIAATPQDEPRIRDLEYAAWLGFRNPIDIRKLIKRLNRDGLLNDSEVLATVAKTSSAGGRPGTEYWLTRAGAVKVAAKSETPRAIAILVEVVRVWDEVRRRIAAGTPISVSAPPSIEEEHRRSLESRRAALEERLVGIRADERVLCSKERAAAALYRMGRTLKKQGSATPDKLLALDIRAAEILTGDNLAAYLPAPASPAGGKRNVGSLPVRAGWRTPTEIADALEVSVARVARAITQLGIRGKPGMSEQYEGTVPESDIAVQLFRYSPPAVSLIARAVCGGIVADSSTGTAAESEVQLSLYEEPSRLAIQPPAARPPMPSLTAPSISPQIIDRRSNADKRDSVVALLRDPQLAPLSNREIARRAGVSDGMVREVRAELYPGEPQAEVIASNGRRVATGSAKKAAAAAGNQNARRKPDSN